MTEVDAMLHAYDDCDLPALGYEAAMPFLIVPGSYAHAPAPRAPSDDGVPLPGSAAFSSACASIV